MRAWVAICLIRSKSVSLIAYPHSVSGPTTWVGKRYFFHSEIRPVLLHCCHWCKKRKEPRRIFRSQSEFCSQQTEKSSRRVTFTLVQGACARPMNVSQEISQLGLSSAGASAQWWISLRMCKLRKSDPDSIQKEYTICLNLIFTVIFPIALYKVCHQFEVSSCL